MENIIDLKKIDLYHEYELINNDVFGGELPHIELIWVNSKKYMGRLKSIYYRYTGRVQVVNIGISKFYAFTYDLLRNVLAHEMIHAKLHLEQNKEHLENDHGHAFLSEMNRINNLGKGYNIQIRSERSVTTVNNQTVKQKDLIIIVYDIDGANGFNITTHKVYKEEFSGLLRILYNMIKMGYYKEIKLTVLKSNDMSLLRFTIQRNLKTRYMIKDNNQTLLEKLLNNEVLEVVNLPSDMETEDAINESDIDYVEMGSDKIDMKIPPHGTADDDDSVVFYTI